MSYPIASTPNPSVHVSRHTSVSAQNNLPVAQISQMFAQLPWTVARAVINAILAGLGLASAEAGADAALAQLQAAFTTVNHDLSDLQTESANAGKAFATFLTSALTDISADVGNFPKLITDLDAAWQTYVTAETGAWNAEMTTISDIVHALTGIDVSNGLFPQTQVASVSGGTSTLSTDLAAISEPFQTGSLFSPSAWSDAMTGLGNLLGVHPTALSTASATAGIASTQVGSPVAGDSNIGVSVTNVQGTAVAAHSNAQSTVDMINQAVVGGNATGASVDTVLYNLSNIPQDNIVINPSSGKSGPITFDATGVGAEVSGNFNQLADATITWSHTVGVSGNHLIVYVCTQQVSASPNVTVTATAGSHTLSLIGTIAQGDFNYYILSAQVPPGTFTISVTAAPGFGIYTNSVFARSMSYGNVYQVAAAYQALSSGTSSFNETLFQNNAPNTLASIAFLNSAPGSGVNSSPSSVVGATVRSTSGTTLNGAVSQSIALMDVTTATAPHLTFATAETNTSGATLSLYLQPSETSVGSYAKAYRSLSSSATLPDTANGMPDGYFDTLAQSSPDITYVKTGTGTQGCYFEVSLAGTYTCTFAVAVSTTGFSENYGAAGTLYINNTAAEVAPVQLPYQGNSSGVVSPAGIVIGGTFTIYLNVNDTVSFGITYTEAAGHTSLTAGGAVFTNIPIAAQNFMSIGLCNRSLH